MSISYSGQNYPTFADHIQVGIHGTLLHYNGTEWSNLNSGTEDGILGIWGSSATNIFAVGEDGIILHYTGKNKYSPNNEKEVKVFKSIE